MIVKTAETLIEEIEYLSSELESLRKAEDLAQDVNSPIYRDLVRLHRQAFSRIKTLVRRILRGCRAMGQVYHRRLER
jgi:hypothetical protein